MTRRAIVVGAGIAGLAATHVLSRCGYKVEVFERDQQLRSEGAGITLWPNALRALAAIGLGEVVAESTQVIDEAVTLTPSGQLLTELPLDRIGKRFGPLVSAHRCDLLDALAREISASITFDAEVHAADGELCISGQRLEADLIVGADGIRSAVREVVAPGVTPRAAGYGAWRGVAEAGTATAERASETMGRGKRFGLVPLKGGRSYWFAVVADNEGEDDLQIQFANWHQPIGEVLEATPSSARSYLPLYDLPRLPTWHRGSIVLIGDAAHATTPNLGQGAAQALEDVAVLGGLLGEERSPDQAFSEFERQRKRRAERVVRRSRAVGRIAQVSNPIAARLRDIGARSMPSALAYHQMASILSPAE